MTINQKSSLNANLPAYKYHMNEKENLISNLYPQDMIFDPKTMSFSPKTSSSKNDEQTLDNCAKNDSQTPKIAGINPLLSSLLANSPLSSFLCKDNPTHPNKNDMLMQALSQNIAKSQKTNPPQDPTFEEF